MVHTLMHSQYSIVLCASAGLGYSFHFVPYVVTLRLLKLLQINSINEQ